MAGGGKVVKAARLVPATVEVWRAARRTMCCSRFPGTVTGPPNVVHADRGRNPREAHDRAETLSECGV
jgi:hypothetical protein